MIANRRVKIVATIGPATNSKENLRKCIEAGMNVARLNFSHGAQGDHEKVIRWIRELSIELRAPVSILQDLQGPKIRVGLLSEPVELVEGQKIIFSASPEKVKDNVIPSDFKELSASVGPGSKILLDDGLMEVVVIGVEGDLVHCEVVFGGLLKSRKGMNLPGANLPVECLTPKDLDDLEFGLKMEVDYVALSFVRQASDIKKLREIINLKNPSTKIISKIEMLEAIDNLKEIVELSDAVMVARGDLAVEVGQTRLPLLQKKIIDICNDLGKPVITATQMLDSMVENPRPTRAEITDVANAVLGGTDACMLSAESASGKYPFKCIRTMGDIILEVEKTGEYFYDISLDREDLSIAGAIAESACLSAMKLNASAIVCLTTTGKTATMISSYRPKSRIIAVTNITKTLNVLELVWGIQTFEIGPYKTTDEAMLQVKDLLIKYNLVKPGEKIILTLGVPVGTREKTNSLRVYNLGDEGVHSVQLKPQELPLRCRPES